jgi:iron complex transport system substrate-binding protein
MQRKRSLLILVLLCAMAMAFAQPTVETPAETVTVEFTDDLGRTVTLPRHIERILPSGTLAQYVLFPLCPEKFVGVSVSWSDSAKGIITDEYLNLPFAGQIYGTKASFNLEEVLKLNPQVVIDVGEQKKGMTENLDKLQSQLGIPIIHIDSSTTTMGEAYGKLGKLLEKESEAKELGDFCGMVLDQTNKIVADRKVRGIYVLGTKGVNVIAKGSYQAEAVDTLMDNAAIVENPTAKGTGNQVDMEMILSWNPEYVIFAQDAKEVYKNAKSDPVWSKVKAIADNHYYLVPNTPQDWLGQPPSVNRFMGLIWATKLLYPESATYDDYAEMKEYFRLFYHAELSKENYESITKGTI